MALGHDYGDDSNGFYIVKPANKFKYSDQFAYVVVLDQSFGTTHVNLVLVSVESGGAETVELTWPMTISNPDFNALANKFSTSVLMGGEAPGKYKLELQSDTATLAQASFTYTG